MALTSFLKILLSALIKPLPLVCIGLVFSWFYMQKRPKGARIVFAVCLLSLLFFSSPHTARMLLSSLENQYPPIAVNKLPTADYAVLLTGSLVPVATPRIRVELGSRADRLLLAQTILLQNQHLPILIAGGPATKNSDGISEAQHSKAILTSWGIDQARITIHNGSKDTLQTVSNVVSALPNGTKSILLITSAYHMPRSMQLFATTDFDVTAATSNHLITSEQDYSISSWIPSSINLSGSALAIHEYLGMLANDLNKLLKSELNSL